VVDLSPYAYLTSGNRCLEDYWPSVFKGGPCWKPFYLPPLCSDFIDGYLQDGSSTNTTAQNKRTLYVEEAYFVGHEGGNVLWIAEVSPLEIGLMEFQQFVTVARNPLTGAVVSTRTDANAVSSPTSCIF